MRGHITKRGDSWTAIVDLPPDPATGKRRQKRVTARTKRDVETQVATLIQAGQTGFTDAGSLTVARLSPGGWRRRRRRCVPRPYAAIAICPGCISWTTSAG